MMHNIWRMPYTAVVGVLIGALVALSMPWVFGVAGDIMDDTWPVLTMHGTLVDHGADYVTVHIEGTKHRGDECRLRAVYGMSVDLDGVRRAAVASRMDGTPPIGMTLDSGRYDIGVWVVRPVHWDAVSVEVYTEHVCAGRPMRSKIADVDLR